MPQTFRESGDPEAAAAVFEKRDQGVCGGCNGLHMSPSLLELAGRDRRDGHFHLWAFAVPDYKTR